MREVKLKSRHGGSLSTQITFLFLLGEVATAKGAIIDCASRLTGFCFVPRKATPLINSFGTTVGSLCMASEVNEPSKSAKNSNQEDHQAGNAGQPLSLQYSNKTDPAVIRRNLELNWKLMTSNEECDLEDMLSCGGLCDICEGEGLVNCRFCAGTGFLTIGEMLMGDGKHCPVCSGDGEEECKSCMGSKWVAKWRLHDPAHLVLGDHNTNYPSP
jgi:hypothetical protein